MVELKLNIEKKHIWLLALLIVAVGFVIAQGPQNPGHDVTQIGGLDQKIDAKIAAKLTSGAIKLDCKIAYKASHPPKSGSAVVECPAGYVLTGGGGSVKYPYHKKSIANLLHSADSTGVPKKIHCNDYSGKECWDLTAVCCRIKSD